MLQLIKDREDFFVKRRMILAALLLSVLLIQGCLLETHPLTEEEQNIIAEYAADVLLRHVGNHAHP